MLVAGVQPALGQQGTADYTVLVEVGATGQAARAAIRAAGGRVTAENTAVGTLTVSAPATGFVQRVTASDAVFGAAPVTPIGQLPGSGNRSAREWHEVESEHVGAAKVATPKAAPKAAPSATTGLDPLDDALWGLRLVRSDIARVRQAGDRRVYVGVLDTGVDGTHPDIAPNFNRVLSRNFTIDIPNDSTGGVLDGPCEFRGCVDPADHDDGGHGTHVAGTIGAAANGFGVSGVAPNVSLVNIRGGQDSGFFFLQPVVDALTYGADVGLDVINMSFFVDPWYMNCTANPADSPEAQIAQRTTIAAIQRALNYAHGKGVTLIGAGGNNHEDLGSPRTDQSSPNYPPRSSYPRPIDNATCLNLPTEGDHVISVSALGPSTLKADYSNYGTEQTALSAPGGYFRDGLGTDWYRTNENLIRSAYPRNVALGAGNIDADGNITPAGLAAGVAKYCDGSTCGYYRYAQGTSMAAPHASGVAALVVSQYGKHDRSHPGTLTLSPDKVEQVLYKTATPRACPEPRTVSYENVDRPAEFTATCVGDATFNGFYGHGIVDAYGAVTRGGDFL
ncbi:serine protease [Saccharothrix sp. NRRL B-16348]|uniref:S8 family serine peptidase n=1 Tax=Saccharothrix sp. NRRL B-16348 TaxID=1415542 RepID=UPI0006C1AEC7|nr:S8 family serine peptidase [Saccharothrix sp. NRRL B-16348]KOX17992.1 serine protease [Saccharothrix sp. NRRL B-16348]